MKLLVEPRGSLLKVGKVSRPLTFDRFDLLVQLLDRLLQVPDLLRTRLRRPVQLVLELGFLLQQVAVVLYEF